MTRPDQPRIGNHHDRFDHARLVRRAPHRGILRHIYAKRAVRLKLNPDSSTNELVCPGNANQGLYGGDDHSPSSARSVAAPFLPAGSRQLMGSGPTMMDGASHADPRTTKRYDLARASLDRHATNIIAAHLARAVR